MSHKRDTSRQDPLTHTLGVPPVDDRGETGITMAYSSTPSSPSAFGPHSLPTSLPFRFHLRPGLRSSLHRLHNAYHYDHHIYSKEIVLPRAFRPCPSAISKERA
jgi:hypothetical protein